MDFAAGTEDVLSHLGVPKAGLMAEVNTGLQHLTHGCGHTFFLHIRVKPPFAYLRPVSYTHLDVYKRQRQRS